MCVYIQMMSLEGSPICLVSSKVTYKVSGKPSKYLFLFQQIIERSIPLHYKVIPQ